MPTPLPGEIVRDIITGIAVTSLLFAVSAFIPFIGILCAILIPLPVLYYRLKLGRKLGAVVPVVAVAVLALLVGQLTVDFYLFIGLMCMGFILGELFLWNLPVEHTVLLTCAGISLIGLLALLMYGIGTGTGISALISGYVAQNLELTLGLYRDMGVPEENIQTLIESMDRIQYILIRLIPGLLLAGELLVCWTSLLLSRPLLISRNLYYPAFGALNTWRAPEVMVWGAIGSGVLLLLPSVGVKLIGANGLMVAFTLYFFQGIGIVAFFFEKKQLPKGMRFFLYGLIALQQILLFIVIGLGFFDIWINFRKLDIASKQR